VYRLLHQWVGLASSAVLVVLAISGFFLIHPGLLGGPMESTLALAVNPNDADHMLRGTLSGLYRSVDGGANWEEVPMLFHAEKVTDIVYAPDDADRVYVVMEDLGLIVSRDGGVVWESVQLGFVPVAEGVRLGRLTAGRGGRIVLATSGGWLKSGDGGKVWRPLGDATEPGRDLRTLIHQLHTGYFFGSGFYVVYDAAALGTVLLAVTGLVIRRRRSNQRNSG